MINTVNKTAPQLRFGEFEGCWSEKKLGDICSVERGKFTPRPRNNPTYYNGEIPFVQTGDVVHSKGIINTHSQTLNEKGLKVSKLFIKGDLLITIAANIGYAGVLQFDMACPDSLIGLKCTSQIENYFLNYLLEIEQPKMDYLAVAAAQKNINIDFLKPYKLTIPSLPEQKKIASFLSAVDAKLQQLNKKKSLLTTYKKGVMQQIFSQQLRFKDANGNNYPDWEEKKIEEVSSCLDNRRKPLNSTERNAMKGEVPYYGANGVVDYINQFLFDDELVLLAEDGGHFFDFYDKPIAQLISGKSWVNNHAHILKSKNEVITTDFLFYSLVHKDIRRYIVGGSRVKLNKSDLMSIKIIVPSLEEQQKIASFLSAFDAKIALVSTQINTTQAFKKGLLQQLFV